MKITGIHRVPDSIDLGWGPNFCILNKFPSDADFPGVYILRTTLPVK